MGDGFKNSVCYDLPMAEVTPTLISYLQDHLLYKNLATKLPAILDSLYSVLTLSSEFQHGWVADSG